MRYVGVRTLMERRVTFSCGHSAVRIARDGRSLVGESVRCGVCHGGDREVVSEGKAILVVGRP